MYGDGFAHFVETRVHRPKRNNRKRREERATKRKRENTKRTIKNKAREKIPARTYKEESPGGKAKDRSVKWKT